MVFSIFGATESRTLLVLRTLFALAVAALLVNQICVQLALRESLELTEQSMALEAERSAARCTYSTLYTLGDLCELERREERLSESKRSIAEAERRLEAIRCRKRQLKGYFPVGMHLLWTKTSPCE